MSIIDITSHQPQNNNIYFLDCNVLMYTFYTNGSYATDLVYDYSLLITKIINTKSKLILTDVLLSEFINTYIQTEFHRLARLNGWPHTKKYFKRTFKLSAEYEDILQEIKYIITRQILPVFSLLDDEFSKITFEKMFDNPDSFDFNDRYYGYCMAPIDAYIVTNDADFSDVTQCNIITKNQTLLNR